MMMPRIMAPTLSPPALTPLTPDPNFRISKISHLVLPSSSRDPRIALQTPPPSPPTMAASTTSNPFIKHLASSDRKTRDRALSSLRTYLASNPSLSPLDLLKIWKALFYSLWMSDKPLTQQRLSQDLASLVDVLPSTPSKVAFIHAFWTTIAREWGHIDALRMDKYLYLVRCYVGKSFEVDGVQLDGEQGPLSARDSRVPDGVRFHVVDVFVDELVKEGRGGREGDWVEVLRGLGRESGNKVVRKRVREALEDERVAEILGEKMEGGGVEAVGAASDGEDGEFGGFDE